MDITYFSDLPHLYFELINSGQTRDLFTCSSIGPVASNKGFETLCKEYMLKQKPVCCQNG
jgi:hypothetical protein